MIDLLRLRISQYRQDRILEELFHGKNSLSEQIRAIYQTFSQHTLRSGLFQEFEKLGAAENTKAEFDSVLNELATKTYTGRKGHVKITSMTSKDQPCAVSREGLSRDFCILSVKCIGTPALSRPSDQDAVLD
jgi:hypothetical protein